MEILSDFVLIKPDETKQATKSGILIQEAWKTLPQTGTVEAIGPRVEGIKVGDRVIFLRYATIDGPDGIKIAKQKHVVGRLDEKK